MCRAHGIGFVMVARAHGRVGGVGLVTSTAPGDFTAVAQFEPESVVTPRAECARTGLAASNALRRALGD